MQKTVQVDVCNERHSSLNAKLDEIHSDVKNIRDNHIHDLNNKIDTFSMDINKRFDGLKLAYILLAVISGIALGIKFTELIGWLP